VLNSIEIRIGQFQFVLNISIIVLNFELAHLITSFHLAFLLQNEYLFKELQEVLIVFHFFQHRKPFFLTVRFLILEILQCLLDFFFVYLLFYGLCLQLEGIWLSFLLFIQVLITSFLILLTSLLFLTLLLLLVHFLILLNLLCSPNIYSNE
jgi:hypothetical protein